MLIASVPDLCILFTFKNIITTSQSMIFFGKNAVVTRNKHRILCIILVDTCLERFVCFFSTIFSGAWENRIKLYYRNGFLVWCL